MLKCSNPDPQDCYIAFVFLCKLESCLSCCYSYITSKVTFFWFYNTFLTISYSRFWCYFFKKNCIQHIVHRSTSFCKFYEYLIPISGKFHNTFPLCILSFMHSSFFLHISAQQCILCLQKSCHWLFDWSRQTMRWKMCRQMPISESISPASPTSVSQRVVCFSCCMAASSATVDQDLLSRLKPALSKAWQQLHHSSRILLVGTARA